ncbi:5-(carboxyamino)imidazole ribonucleotide mutase [Archaeoglobus veneficus]|uniref:Phosphoribosylaminoimidazole carboxylase n=1 Tax=Archaeoglobus veneficus (strain DSM 11195 / SNP6) TaxID=693661 RepID=F2KMZ0_ARCVS|nr:5-(carboxyamino)imidazole ribonucleotide mutase [Archaeoglobus veneficus]AEA47266.1 phosphoribosylaminoimidazole carboxylase, catalytic subunit [Archaeoglobus veneficus SNP6]
MDVVILMGSKSDMEFAKRIGKTLEKFGVEFCYRIASAHKTPEKVLEILKEYDDAVFITVAGRSNALSGFVDANTVSPVIACPPYSDRFAGMDILSSLRMPSGVAPLVVLEPENAAIAAVKILAIKRHELREMVAEYQRQKRLEIEEADANIRGTGHKSGT